MKLTEERARELVEEIVYGFLIDFENENNCKLPEEVFRSFKESAWDNFEEWDSSEEEIREIYTSWIENGKEYLEECL